MAGVPTVFRKSPEKLINVDWQDFAAGFGYVTLYGMIDQDGNGILTKATSIYSDKIWTQDTITSTDYTKELDIDFDIDIDKPLDVKGIAYVNVPFLAWYSNSGGTTKGYAYVIAKLIHYDGSTETQMATETSNVVEFVGGGGYSRALMCNLKLDCSTMQHFKIGDTIRLTIEVYGKYGTGSTGAIVQLAHDPANRAGNADYSSGGGEVGKFLATDQTVLKLNLPIIIE